MNLHLERISLLAMFDAARGDLWYSNDVPWWLVGTISHSIIIYIHICISIYVYLSLSLSICIYICITAEKSSQSTSALDFTAYDPVCHKSQYNPWSINVPHLYAPCMAYLPTFAPKNINQMWVHLPALWFAHGIVCFWCFKQHVSEISADSVINPSDSVINREDVSKGNQRGMPKLMFDQCRMLAMDLQARDLRWHLGDGRVKGPPKMLKNRAGFRAGFVHGNCYS